MSQREEAPHAPNQQYITHFVNKQKQMFQISKTHAAHTDVLLTSPSLHLHTHTCTHARTHVGRHKYFPNLLKAAYFVGKKNSSTKIKVMKKVCWWKHGMLKVLNVDTFVAWGERTIGFHLAFHGEEDMEWTYMTPPHYPACQSVQAFFFLFSGDNSPLICTAFFFRSTGDDWSTEKFYTCIPWEPWEQLRGEQWGKTV